MPTSAERARDICLVDTSTAVALVVADHEAHDETVAAIGRQALGLAGHSHFETYSVLTRLPSPVRRAPTDVVRIIRHNFPHGRFLSARRMAALLARLPALGVAGGSVYDALIGAVAQEHGLPLATRDRRALDVYRALDVEVRLLP